MATALAMYEALVQANVPAGAARRVAEALEADMAANLASKQDMRSMQQEMQLLQQEIRALDQRMVERFVAVGRELDLRLESLESRLVIKLGALMTALTGIAATALTLLS
jgi:hypothetical protein